jgi:hypothetical protein
MNSTWQAVIDMPHLNKRNREVERGKWFDKSVFTSFATDGIFAKWSDKVPCGTLNLFAILYSILPPTTVNG